MDDIEKIARELHKKGYNCSCSLHTAFKDTLKLGDDYPAPRSIDGICGAVLVTKYIFEKTNNRELISEFEESFLNKYGSLKCKDLTGNRDRCNDYIGFCSNYINEKIKKSSI